MFCLSHFLGDRGNEIVKTALNFAAYLTGVTASVKYGDTDSICQNTEYPFPFPDK